MNKTSIQWTWEVGTDSKLIPDSGSTWNPLKGCRRKSPGCERCYAERLIATRLRRLPMYQGLAAMTSHGPRFTGEHRVDPYALDAPLRARRGRKIFVNDMGDLFYEGHTFEEIAGVYGIMAAAHWHTFQVLTKRIERAAEFYAWLEAEGRKTGAPNWRRGVHERLFFHMLALAGGATLGPSRGRPETPEGWHDTWPLPNVWLGASVEDVPRKARIDALRPIPAVVRFLSVEPQIEDLGVVNLDGIHWVICGGESGSGARPYDLRWPRSLRDQCAAAGTAFFMKQYGRWPLVEKREATEEERRAYLKLKDGHGGDPKEWHDDLRVREFPVPFTVGKSRILRTVVEQAR